ncbi:MFS transporter [Nocardioides dubius]|uniref:MFS transporter n=1 Tax=Nocardioides dubius TaxID=317019 RepID=A0ABP4E7Q5_9ACTN
MSTATPARGGWTPWRTIWAFGFVSLFADMVYEGMRSISGPYLGALGASALVVGLVTGAGEAMALVLRLVSGRLADRTGAHWRLTILGYAMTAVCVPLLAVAPFVGGAGLAVASVLILAERTGKAVRSPSKSALLASMTKPVGRGRGFGVHKALDQVGAFSGPLVIAGVVALTGRMWLALALLAIPGALSLVLLARLRRRMPVEERQIVEPAPQGGAASVAPGREPLPRTFHQFSLACALSTLGLMTFGVISYAFVEEGLFSAAATPLVYAGAMAVAAVAALLTGQAYDRIGARVLYVVPVAVALVPFLVFTDQLAVLLVGMVAWAVATGVQDSTVKALVADLVPKQQLGTAYGVFAAAMGVAALAGGALAGGLHQEHRELLIAVIGVCQVAAFVLLVRTIRAARQATHH